MKKTHFSRPTDNAERKHRSDQRSDQPLNNYCLECHTEIPLHKRLCRTCLAKLNQKHKYEVFLRSQKGLPRIRRIKSEILDLLIGIPTIIVLTIPMFLASPRIFFWCFWGFFTAWGICREYLSPGRKLTGLRVYQTRSKWANKKWPLIVRKLPSVLIQSFAMLGLIHEMESAWGWPHIVKPLLNRSLPGVQTWPHFGKFVLIISFIYYVLALFFLMIDGKRRRWEDYLTGTVVVDRKVYEQMNLPCIHCSGPMQQGDRICRHCGVEPPQINRPEAK